jgi:hypothetical protein
LTLSPPPQKKPGYATAQVIFEPNLFLYKYPNNPLPLIHPAYTTYGDGIEKRSEMLVHKIQMPGNHTNKRTQHSEKW